MSIEKIQANAELVVTIARDQMDTDLEYDEAGVEWLDGYIERQRQREDLGPEKRRGLVNTLGAFLGECIVQSFGGEWAQVDGSWAVRFDERNAAFPFAKVAKHLENGQGDSVLSFFQTIPVLFHRNSS